MRGTVARMARARMVRQFSDKLADDVTSVVEKHVDKVLAGVHAGAMRQLREQLAGGAPPALAEPPVTPQPMLEAPRPAATPAAPRPPATPAPDRARRAAIAASAKKSSSVGATDVTNRGQPRQRPPRRCSKCGELGRRADQCGITHNVTPTLDSPPADEEDEPAVHAEPILELRVAPPSTLVRRGRNAVRNPDVSRPKTFSAKRITRDMLAGGEIEVAEVGPPIDAERPRTRAECVDGERPCPWVSCRHHLYLDVVPETGSIKINFPGREVEEFAESCSLDVADRGGRTLVEVAELVNVTRERIRQLEVKAFFAMKAAAARAHIHDDDLDAFAHALETMENVA